ncbi:proline-rich receptor-like protein kinase PERK2 [Iris pallida]|uniref:Proline-rich receptor-like protein kinase PERK2 n=1 Tax=Iris pallida TaxID=29817 RepID=A0AAX6DXT7_IRIPA|nr:proline-rich receptor-like protein kinase PERK2 [Iris pallida]
MCRQTRHNKSNPIPHQPHQHPTSSTLLPCHQLHPGELDTTSSSLTPQTPLWPATSRRHHQHSHTTTVPVVNTTTTESIMEGGRLLPILGCSRPRVHLAALRRSNSPRHGCSTAGTDPSTHKSDVAPPSVPPPPNPPRAPSPPLVATTAAPGKTPPRLIRPVAGLLRAPPGRGSLGSAAQIERRRARRSSHRASCSPPRRHPLAPISVQPTSAGHRRVLPQERRATRVLPDRSAAVWVSPSLRPHLLRSLPRSAASSPPITEPPPDVGLLPTFFFSLNMTCSIFAPLQETHQARHLAFTVCIFVISCRCSS